MVDPERLHRVLRRIADDVAVLRDYAQVDPEQLLHDPVRLGHIKYLFITAIEGCIDAAQHVCASEGWGPPQTNADAMSVLARHDTLTPTTARVMAEAVRFRNVLVHGYAEVDDRLVVRHLQRLDALEGFIDQLAVLLEE